MKRELLFPIILILIFTTICGISVGKFLNEETYVLLFYILIGSIILVISFFRTDIGICILILSLSLSPEVDVASVPGRSVSIRLDDFLLFILFFTWLAKITVYKQFKLLKQTPLNMPLGFYTVICILSTLSGSSQGDVVFIKGIFYLLKYVEYFMLFFIVTNNLDNRAQIRQFIILLLVTSVPIILYGYSQIGSGIRISMPFEGANEPNTFGGYLIIIFSISSCLILSALDWATRLPNLILVVLLVFPFIYTYSRASILGIVSSFIISIFVFPRRIVILLLASYLLVSVSPILLPEKFFTRLQEPFTAKKKVEVAPVFGIELNPGDSSYTKIQSLQNVIALWEERPFLGYGVTGIGLVDTQYARILGETGLLGFGAFIWMILTIIRLCFMIFRNSSDNFFQAITRGYFCCLIGLLIHGLGANTFIITRIMGPFWLLTAIIVSIPLIEGKDKTRIIHVSE